MQVKIGDLVKVLISEFGEGEILIPAGVHGLVMEKIDLGYETANGVYLIKLMSNDGQDHCSSYYASDLKVINASR
jgi:hypothetical protein